MSAIENNTWAPRSAVILVCPSGSRCEVKRPGPELGLEVGQLQRTLRPLQVLSRTEEGRTLAETEERERAEAVMEVATPEQRRASLDIMRATVAACVVRPRIYVNPQPGQVGVDDIPPEDFLFIWNWHKGGCADVPVETEGGEVAVSAVENFPDKQAAGVGTGDSGSDVRTKAVKVGGAKRRRGRR